MKLTLPPKPWFSSQQQFAATMRAARVILLVTLTVGNLALPSTSAPAGEKYESLKTWDGKYPSGAFDKKTGDYHKFKVGFFALPEVKQPLDQLLNHKEFELLTKQYEVESPIKTIGEYVCAKNCRAHNCGNENAAFSVDVRDGSIYVMFFDSGKRRWLSSKGKYTDLPKDVQNYMADFGAS
jgi:hypothetical protein